MSFSRYDNKRKPPSHQVVSPWASGFPQQTNSRGGDGLLPTPTDQLALAGNLLGSILGSSSGVNIASSFAQAFQPQTQGILPLSGGENRNRDALQPRLGRRPSPPRRDRAPRRSRSRSRSRDTRRRGRSHDRKRRRSPPRRARSPVERAAHEIYIGNYPVRFRENDVRKLFEEHGVNVVNIRMKNDGQKVFAFAETTSKEEIEKAVKAMDSKEIFGRRLRVRCAKDSRDKKANTTPASTTESKATVMSSSEPELTESKISRYLAFAITQFLDRQVEVEGNSDDVTSALKSAKDSIRKAFHLPYDDSLQVDRRLEMVFMQNNSRQLKALIKKELDTVEIRKEELEPELELDTAQSSREIHDDDDYDGNWKRRKVDNTDDEEEEDVTEANGELKQEETPLETTTDLLEVPEPELEDLQGADKEIGDGQEETSVDDVHVETSVQGSEPVDNENEPEIQLENDEILDSDDENKPEAEKNDSELEASIDEEAPLKPAGRGRGRGSGRARRSRGRRL